MDHVNTKYSNSQCNDDTRQLISVKLRIDYENESKKNMKCEQHSTSDASSYCCQCKQKLCVKCEAAHAKHALIDRNLIVLEKIENISSLIEKFCNIKSDISDVLSQCDRQRNTIFNDQKASRDSIDIMFSDLHRDLDRLKSELLLELHQVVDSCLSRLDANKVELQALHDDVSSITELVVLENSAFQYYDIFELEEFTKQKLINYTDTIPLDHLRPNELNIQVKWTGTVRDIVKLPLAKINCHIGPERLSHVKTVPIRHRHDKHKSYISSVSCDRDNIIYLCDSANKNIKVLNKDYTLNRRFTGTGIHKLASPVTVLCLPVPDRSLDSRSIHPCASIIVADPGSENVVTFNPIGQGVDLFVTNGSSTSMCSIVDINELENLQESSLELSPIYTTIDEDQSPDTVFDRHAIIICSKLENLHLEFIQINPVTLKLYKSRPDLGLTFLDNCSTFQPTCIAWNHVSKYFFLLNSLEHKVLIFSSQDGRFIRFYGRFGSGYEEFNAPTNILVDKDGNVLISDMFNSRIHVLDSLGNFVKFLFPFTHRQTISKPTAMCFDNCNNLIICEGDEKIKIYTY